MARRFFSLPFPIFGTVAMALVCLVFFLLPFSMRGARLGMRDTQNNVADWLPSEYAETKDLGEFRKYFYGDQFVVVSGPWCTESNPIFSKFKEAIRRESLEYETELKAEGREEELRARRKGDELGLLFTGDYHQTWGENDEKWLQGKNGKWYFIDRKGQLFRWDGQNNVVEGIKRLVERLTHGKNKSKGTYVDTFGPPLDDGSDNPFYEDPLKICCRPFKSIISGPDAFQKMAGPEGTLRLRKSGKSSDSDLSAFEAEMQAHKILSGAMFGPTPSKKFNWTFESLLQEVDPRLQVKLKSDPNLRNVFDQFIASEVRNKFEGDRNKFLSASQSTKLETWYRTWHQLEIPAPPRQTCFIVTLNEPIIEELSRAIGRPLMGKPRGRLLEIGVGVCGIDANNLRLGGPPCDNVAIDEEGTNTLVRLAGLSFIVGMSLAYISFGSIRVAFMIFFVGGVAAISSLAVVWYGGSSMDAILMTMPSLVYVLGLSAAVHYVNYYRDECHENGPRKAAENALAHSWFPTLLCAFTTGLGLISLTTSNLKPIYKFGLFSAITVVATVALLYLFLPSALTVWKPGYRRISKNSPRVKSRFGSLISSIPNHVCQFVIERRLWVFTGLVGLMIALSLGLFKVKTTVQLLKLFDADSKILKDYAWLEENIGELVPAEIVLYVDKDAQKEAYAAEVRRSQLEKVKQQSPSITPEELNSQPIEFDRQQLELKYSILERTELSSKVRQQLEKFFGSDGIGVVGSGMSTDVFTPIYRLNSNSDSMLRFNFSSALEAQKQDMVDQDYLAVAGESEVSQNEDISGREMWRISIRLAALSNVDYGQFVNDLKQVVEPILQAYQSRSQILKELFSGSGEDSINEAKVLVLGTDPDFSGNSESEQPRKKKSASSSSLATSVDQTYIFADTLKGLLENRGFVDLKKNSKKGFKWIDPARDGFDLANLAPDLKKSREAFFQKEQFASYIEKFDCVNLIQDHPLFDVELIRKHAKKFVDSRQHKFQIDPGTYQPVAGSTTLRERQKEGEKIDVSAIYTGIVPIVYKAQRALLQSLVESIAMSFVMIALVMMLLVRRWNERPNLKNLINLRGGLLAMIPNVFPVLVVFGYMGWAGIEVDIGSMMTASVAMGIAVDDTIHFLTWYRQGLSQGLDRKAAIRFTYDKVAIAMIQTSLIAGLGLACFALSTFTPTQRFGVMMLFLLFTALIGDLLVLPAILSSRLGKYFDLQDTPPQLSADTSGQFSGDEIVPIKFRVISDEPATEDSDQNLKRKKQL